MFTRKLLPALLLFFAIATQAQKNFTYTPEKPKPGDVITFTYEPAGDIANTVMVPDAIVYYQTDKSRKADDVVLKRIGNKFNGSIQTDAATVFISLGFSVDKKFDNNFNDGYYIQLYENDKPRIGSNYNLSLFYQFYGTQVGLERNNEKALNAMGKELELYPEQKNKYLSAYVGLMVQAKKPDYLTAALKETEAFYKKGLKEEADYEQLEGIYRSLKFNEQMKFITALKKEKFPDGRWTMNETLQKYFAETNIDKKKTLLAQIVQKTESGDENWKVLKDNLSFYKLQIATTYANAKKWDEFKKAVEESGVTDKTQLASIYNNTSWEMQKTSDNLAYAEEISRLATTQAKDEWKNPASKRPDYVTASQWEKQKEMTYAMYADTYGMIMYRMGQYKKGLPYAKDAAILINKGKDADQNNTYALLAEKTLPKKQYVKELEQFVKDGKSTADMKDILKRAYVKDKKSEAGFDDYIAVLQKESYVKMLEELRKSMLNETASSFALVDLDGKKVQLSDLKGKVVVMDFWATWCGPCKASFPSMQKMVTRYKDDPNVKFIFIDTWEKGENKQKDAADFIANNKYTFHVLQDTEDKIVAEYKVDGIPTKFVIDKKGMVRFKAIGFDGSDDKLVQELTAMIEMASNEDGKKAF